MFRQNKCKQPNTEPRKHRISRESARASFGKYPGLFVALGALTLALSSQAIGLWLNNNQPKRDTTVDNYDYDNTPSFSGTHPRNRQQKTLDEIASLAVAGDLSQADNNTLESEGDVKVVVDGAEGGKTYQINQVSNEISSRLGVTHFTHGTTMLLPDNLYSSVVQGCDIDVDTFDPRKNPSFFVSVKQYASVPDGHGATILVSEFMDYPEIVATGPDGLISAYNCK